MLKYLKAKFIIPALILLVAIILVLLYFVGALHVSGATFDNKDFNFDDFTDVNDIETLSLKKKVAENKNYVMYFNEDTTIVSIVKKNAKGEETDIVYSTAVPSTFDASSSTYVPSTVVSTLDGQTTVEPKKISSEMKSNFTIYYLDKDNNRVTTGLTALENSVAFVNELTGTIDKHYYINYTDTGVQVCYDVGRFGSSSDYFPQYVKASDLADTLRGNVLLIEDNAALDKGRLEYKNAIVYGVSAAMYIEENGLCGSIVTRSGGEDVDPETQNETTEYIASEIEEDLAYGYGEYINCEDSPLHVNPFFSKRYWDKLVGSYNLEIGSETYLDEDGNSIPYYYTTVFSATAIPEIYEYLYTSHEENKYLASTITLSKQTGKFIPILDEYDNPVIRGGFQAKDEDGNYLYETDDNGDYLYDDNGHLIPVQELYTKELADLQQSFFAIEGTSLPLFRVAIEFNLEDDGMTATILHNSLEDSSNYEKGKDEKYNTQCQLCEIIMFPYFASSFLSDAVDENGDILGQIILPDGSGSSIHFNNGAGDRGDAAYVKQIYGKDTSHLEKDLKPTDISEIMFPMFGFLDNVEDKGIMAVMDQGAGMSSIFANTYRSSCPANLAYFQTKFREVENVVILYGWYRDTYTKYAASLAPMDFVYNYTLLEKDELDYSTLAKKYRAHLFEEYDFESTDETLDHPVIDLNFIGAYRHYQLTLGIIYYRKSPLASFEEAKQIVTELKSAGINNMNVSYKAWTQDALEPKLRKNVKAAKAVGGQKAMHEFADFLAKEGIDFYPELNISYSKGYKYNFGTNKYTTRSVSNEITKMYDFDLAKLMYDKQSKPSYIISPKFYMDISENYAKSYAKTKANGIYLLDLGNSKIGDYHKGKLLYSDEAQKIVQNTLGYWNNDYKVQLKAPFDYAIKYASNIVEVPFETTKFTIVNDEIPFYQLVLSGVVDYSSIIINGNDDHSVDWFLCKAIESGSNLYYQLAEEDNSVLLETDYTQYYRVNYAQWKDTIIDMYNKLDQTGIAKGSLVYHKTINIGTYTISYVEYSNGLKFYINSNSAAVTYDGKNIPAYSWINA